APRVEARVPERGDAAAIRAGDERLLARRRADLREARDERSRQPGRFVERREGAAPSSGQLAVRAEPGRGPAAAVVDLEQRARLVGRQAVARVERRPAARKEPGETAAASPDPERLGGSRRGIGQERRDDAARKPARDVDARPPAARKTREAAA